MNGWHLDKRVPISIIAAILFQTGALIWWASSIESRVSSLEREYAATSISSDRLSRLEARQDLILQRITELSRKLDDL